MLVLCLEVLIMFLIIYFIFILLGKKQFLLYILVEQIKFIQVIKYKYSIR